MLSKIPANSVSSSGPRSRKDDRRDSRDSRDSGAPSGDGAPLLVEDSVYEE